MNKNKERANWLAGLLTGWGMKESWAKVIAGAIIGALAAVGVLTLDSCTPVQVKQAKCIHEVYHVLTGTECKLASGVEVVTVLEEGKK